MPKTIRFSIVFFALASISLTTQVQAQIQSQPNKRPPPIDLDATGSEYHRYSQQYYEQYLHSLKPSHSPQSPHQSLASSAPILRAIELGNRNLEWLKTINKKRAQLKQPPISFTNPSNTNGYPITEPKTYSPEIIEDQTTELLYKMPPIFRQVIDANTPLPEYPNLPLNDYIKWSNKVDHLYQLATRWQLMIPWLGELTEARQEDVRGFYFLSQEPNLEKKLKNFDKLNKSDQKRLSEYLIMICQNTEGVIKDPCTSNFNQAASLNKVYEFYQKYQPNSQALWNDFFVLGNPRNDLIWNSTNPGQLLVPFLNPNDATVESFLRDNLQDEWKLASWKLLLQFSSIANIRINFEPDVTPHVDSLGGNVITMNQSTPLTEYDVQWTIRHEFGHTLGFKDCYIEFYIPAEKVIMAYQLDITNLMCSRKGHLKQTHFDQLKKNYFKP